jgi:hypothetical protein
VPSLQRPSRHLLRHLLRHLRLLQQPRLPLGQLLQLMLLPLLLPLCLQLCTSKLQLPLAQVVTLAV